MLIRPCVVVLLLFSQLSFGGASRRKEPLVVLNPGHTPKAPGQISITGKPEVEYNDALAESVRAKLAAGGGIRTLLTRRPGEETSLAERAEKANQASADLSISLHHDSANDRYVEAISLGGKPAFRALPSLRQKFQIGFSVFVSSLNPKFEESKKCAAFQGQGLKGLGRNVSNHHEEKIPNEGRPFLDRSLGVYQYDELAVLKKTKMPAVLVELAVIVDEAEESWIANPANRERAADAIAAEIRKCLGL